jgi:hypothetical protein
MKKLWVKVYRIRTHDPHFVRKCVRRLYGLGSDRRPARVETQSQSVGKRRPIIYGNLHGLIDIGHTRGLTKPSR